MLGKNVTVASRDPHTGEPMSVDVHGAEATWRPTDVVVTVHASADEGTNQAAQVSCPTVNFFASAASARAYALEHGLKLEVLTMTQALELAGGRIRAVARRARLHGPDRRMIAAASVLISLSSHRG